MNYAVQYNALQRRYESLLADLRQVLGLLRRRRTRAALSLLESVLDGDESDMSGRAEPEATDEPMTVEDVHAALLSQVPAPPAPVAFVGRCFCLDDAPARSRLRLSVTRLIRQPQMPRRSRCVVVAATARTCTCSLAVVCGWTLSLKPRARTALTV